VRGRGLLRLLDDDWADQEFAEGNRDLSDPYSQGSDEQGEESGGADDGAED
jgi:hypothetical protein